MDYVRSMKSVPEAYNQALQRIVLFDYDRPDQQKGVFGAESPVVGVDPREKTGVLVVNMVSGGAADAYCLSITDMSENSITIAISLFSKMRS